VVHGSYGLDWQSVHAFVHLRVPSTIELCKLVLEKMTLLHQAGYVHGDLLDTNLMVRTDGHLDSCWWIWLGGENWGGMLFYECEYRPSTGCPPGAYTERSLSWTQYRDAPEYLWGWGLNELSMQSYLSCHSRLHSDSCLHHGAHNIFTVFQINWYLLHWQLDA